MAATLKDIAKLLGVSVNTVSRGLKDKPDIGAATRRRIKEAAEALGYRPNLNARSLLTGKTHMIGAAFTELSNPVRMEFCERLRHYAADAGYRLLISALDFDGWNNGKNMNVLGEFIGLNVDALIIGFVEGLVSEQPLGKILRECRSSGKLVELFGTPSTDLADCVSIDFRESARIITEYMISRGYGSDLVLFRSEEKSPRWDGYADALQKHALPCREFRMRDLRMESAVEAMERWLAEHKRPPRAIVAATDMAAFGIISVLYRHGFRVPEDCAVCGFDNIALDACWNPPLTSIGFNNGQFARTLWNMTEARLRDGLNSPVRKVVLRQELAVREST